MNREAGKQTILYILGSIGILLIGFAVKSIQTNGLSPEDFGNYTFISSYVAFTVLLFQFGYIPTLKLVMARENDINQNSLIGAGFLLTLILGLLFSIFIFISSFFVDGIFNTDVSEILLICSPLFFSFLFLHFFNAVSTGMGKPSLGVFFELISRLLYAAVLYYFYTKNELTVFNVLLFSVLAHLFTILTFFFLLKPSFSAIKIQWKVIRNAHKSFGRDYYIGSLANQTTFKIDDLFIAAWVSPLQLGFYALARLLTSPIGLVSSALNNALFKSYSQGDRIPSRIFVLNTMLAFLGVVIINIIAAPLIDFIFGEEYIVSANYIGLFSIAFFFMAMYQPFNFLTAKGMGKVVRNTSFAESAVNILGNFILIPAIGIRGALITTIAARLIHFIMKWYYYKRYLKNLNG